MPYRVAVVESPSHLVLELCRTVRADAAGEDVDRGMRALYTVAATAGMTPCGPPSTTYRGAFVPGTSTEGEFRLPVTAGPLGLEEVAVRRIEPARYARTLHRGHYHGISAAYRALDEWLRDSAFRPVGPPTEVYHVAPEGAVSPQDLLTEIRIPVAAADLTASVALPVTDVVPILREALAGQGFRVLTEVDMRATLCAHHDGSAAEEPLEDYVVLGVCHPAPARRALAADRRSGLALPLDVVARAEGDTTVIDAADPETLVPPSAPDALREAARETRMSLVAAMRAAAERAPAAR